MWSELPRANVQVIQATNVPRVSNDQGHAALLHDLTGPCSAAAQPGRLRRRCAATPPAPHPCNRARTRRPGQRLQPHRRHPHRRGGRPPRSRPTSPSAARCSCPAPSTQHTSAPSTADGGGRRSSAAPAPGPLSCATHTRSRHEGDATPTCACLFACSSRSSLRATIGTEWDFTAGGQDPETSRRSLRPVNQHLRPVARREQKGLQACASALCSLSVRGGPGSIFNTYYIPTKALATLREGSFPKDEFSRSLDDV